MLNHFFMALKKGFMALVLMAFYFSVPSVWAQEKEGAVDPDSSSASSSAQAPESSAEGEQTPELTPEPVLQAVIRGEGQVRVKRNIIFDASASILLPGDQEARYQWNFGDGKQAEGQEVVHTYETPGNYEVTLTLTQGEQTATQTQSVFVFNKLVLLITDAAQWQQNIEKLKEDAAAEGTYLFALESYEANPAFVTEDNLYAQLNDNLSVLAAADQIALWTTRSNGVNALARLVQQNSDREGKTVQESLRNKTILVITNENINTLGRILQGSYNILRPKQMVIARQYELRNFISAENDQAFLNNLKTSISDYSLINAETGKLSLWNAISYLVSYMISQGIPSSTIILLLMLPVIATVIALLKQVVGITTFGIYTPSIITLSFLSLGWQTGLAILLILVLSGILMKKILNHFNLLHIPRVALLLTLLTFVILLALALGAYLNFNSVISVAIFPILVMMTLAEKYVVALTGKKLTSALILMLETAVVSLICYWVVEWQYLQNLVLGHPEILLLFLLFNYGLGRWTGLRLMEYVRFREVMKHSEE